MNKRLIAVPLILLLCVLALTGCSSVRVFERDIQVVLEVNGELTGSETVNIFNNAVVTEPTAPDNKVYKGWTTQESWEDAEADEVPCALQGYRKCDSGRGAECDPPCGLCPRAAP